MQIILVFVPAKDLRLFPLLFGHYKKANIIHIWSIWKRIRYKLVFGQTPEPIYIRSQKQIIQGVCGATEEERLSNKPQTNLHSFDSGSGLLPVAWGLIICQDHRGAVFYVNEGGLKIEQPKLALFEIFNLEILIVHQQSSPSCPLFLFALNIIISTTGALRIGFPRKAIPSNNPSIYSF